ncbi:KilA-N domain-containing protein [Flavobacterium sp. RSP29]|uniref:KilA-N domain-containing protein n=1 Tax=Flavobacterium sp. RSP29 TaxID=3401731 RepID=UPI003AAA2DE4
METTIENKRIFGIYKDKTIHWHLNENNNYMINASDIAELLNIDLSKFLESQDAKLWIKTLIEKKPKLTHYKVNNVPQSRILGEDLALQDILLIENRNYYLHKFLIYQMTNELDREFYWWFDQILFNKISEHANGIFI